MKYIAVFWGVQIVGEGTVVDCYWAEKFAAPSDHMARTLANGMLNGETKQRILHLCAIHHDCLK
jgi:hypothetical protein